VEHVTAFLGVRDSPGRVAWLKTYFNICALYPADEPDRNVIEDIIRRELNSGFSSQFRCPSCGRLAIQDALSGLWEFYLPERPENRIV
jgi:hypothetical protein